MRLIKYFDKRFRSKVTLKNVWLILVVIIYSLWNLRVGNLSIHFLCSLTLHCLDKPTHIVYPCMCAPCLLGDFLGKVLKCFWFSIKNKDWFFFLSVVIILQQTFHSFSGLPGVADKTVIKNLDINGNSIVF